MRRRLAALFEQGAQPPQKARVRGRVDDRIQRLTAMAYDIEVFLLPGNRYCSNLANSLIESCRPLFNLATYMEPSGSSFIYQTAEEFPRFTTRPKEGSAPADFYGPFPSATRDLLIKSVSEWLGIRTCQPMPRRACMSYALKLCSAPCEGRVTREEYARRVAQAARFFTAPGPELVEGLEAQRKTAAEALDFERAGRIHAQIQALQPAIARLEQERGQQYDADHEVHILYVAQEQAMLVVFQDGSPRTMELVEAAGSAEAFLTRRYSHGAPPEIILGGELPVDAAAWNAAALAAELTQTNGYPVTINQPTSGPAFDLLEIARVNHAYRASQRGHTG